MNRKSITLILSILLLIILPACGSAPAATELPATSAAGPGSEVLPASSTPDSLAPVTEISPLPAGLKVAFVFEGNVWFWSETTPARQLTSDGDASQVILSDDGTVIAYQRGQSLWAVNADGSLPRQLVDVPAFTGRPLPGQFDFQPNSHTLFFVTYETVEEVYSLPSNNLHRVDADAPAPQTILAQGGGEFTFSPDGRLIALAQTSRINVAYTDSTGLISALDFPQVKTYNDSSFIPQVVWLVDSTGFYTVIPASDPAANPGQKSRFLYVAADGSFSAQLAEFAAAPVRVGEPLIAPNGSKVAYATLKDSTLDIHVIDASTADLVVASHTDTALVGLWAWSPDSARFVYHAGDPSRLLLTGINLPSAPLVDALASYSFTWVAADKFLYFRDGELRLGQVGNPILTVIATGFSNTQEDTRYYDFAQ